MKVLFVIDSLGTGGAERDLAERLPRLGAFGITPIVVALRHRDEGVQAELQRQGFDIRVVTGGNPLTQALALRRIIRAERPDVVHTVLFHADILGRFAARGTGATVLTRLVNTDYDDIRARDPHLNTWRFRLARLIDGWTARHWTHRIYANSEAVRTAAVRDLGLRADRVAVIRGARDAARLGEPSARRRHEARGRLGLDADQPVLVNVGRLDYQKGQRFLLEAMVPLVARYPQLVLLIAGRRGGAARDLERQCEALGLQRHVRLLGHRDDVPEILAAADLFVFPTLYEGLPGAVMEAMALGLPIVASDIDPVRETVVAGRNALLVPREDAGALATAIARLLGDAGLAQAFGRESRLLFVERFTLDDSLARLCAFLRDAAVARDGARPVSAD